MKYNSLMSWDLLCFENVAVMKLKIMYLFLRINKEITRILPHRLFYTHTSNCRYTIFLGKLNSKAIIHLF
jgi:hypothetical protein